MSTLHYKSRIRAVLKTWNNYFVMNYQWSSAIFIIILISGCASTDPTYYDVYYVTMAKERSDCSLCEGVVGYDMKQICLSAANSYKNIDSCNNTGNMTYYCYLQIAKNQNDDTYCENILDEDF